MAKSEVVLAQAFVRLAGRLNIEIDLPGKGLVFDTQKECVEYHEF